MTGMGPMRSPMRPSRHAVTLVFLGACTTQAPDEPVTRSGVEDEQEAGPVSESGADANVVDVEPDASSTPGECAFFRLNEDGPYEAIEERHVDGLLTDYVEAAPGEDCDCSAERPCPMRCGGAYPSEGDHVEIDPQVFGFCSDPIDREQACPVSTSADACGGIMMSHTWQPWRWSLARITRWYDPITFVQIGWEARFGNMLPESESFVRYCGGVLPDSRCRSNRLRPIGLPCWSDAGGLNRVDPNAETCECPPAWACEG
jgi:hypothetical protein